MSTIRVLVGTKKGAFILTADGRREKWEVTGPFFAGWELYHLKGSPANPERLYASQSSGWFGQMIQRSDDGGKNWEAVGNEFKYEKASPGRTESGTTARSTRGSSNASGISNRRRAIPTPSMPGRKTRLFSRRRMARTARYRSLPWKPA